MGDADCTYDFRDIQAFVDKFRAGSEFVMGSRFKGSIEQGAMPPLHRYFGTPLTTWILNVMYGTRFSDIHCGMRGITLDALKRINLVSQSWEYASEMVLKSVHLNLTTSEVPVSFLNAPEGRVSHLVQGGWSTPWKAGWINLKAMFVFGADFFLIVPGLLLLVLGFVPLVLLAAGPRVVGEITFSVNSMLVALVVSILGLQFIFIGAIAQSLYDTVGRKRQRWLSLFAYTRTTLLAAAVFLAGLLLDMRFVAAFAAEKYQMSEALIAANHMAIFGMFLMMGSLIAFVSMLLIHAVALYLPLGPPIATGTARIVSAAESGGHAPPQMKGEIWRTRCPLPLIFFRRRPKYWRRSTPARSKRSRKGLPAYVSGEGVSLSLASAAPPVMPATRSTTFARSAPSRLMPPPTTCRSLPRAPTTRAGRRCSRPG